jgi:hypothetical protein
MIRREMIRRVERLETRMGLKRPRLQFMIRFFEPDGTVASSLLLNDKGDQDRLNQVRPIAPHDSPEQKTPPRLTEHQTWVNEVGRRLGLEEAMLKNHPMRHVLTMAVGVSDQLRVHQCQVQPSPGRAAPVVHRRPAWRHQRPRKSTKPWPPRTPSKPSAVSCS